MAPLSPLLTLVTTTFPLILATPTAHAPRQSTGLVGALFGPLTIPVGSSIQNANLTLVNFNDEVFDISSISVFGDINDGGCAEAEEEAQPAAVDTDRSVILGPADIPWTAAEVQSSEVTLINFEDEVFDVSSISIFGDINEGACAPVASKV